MIERREQLRAVSLALIRQEARPGTAAGALLGALGTTAANAFVQNVTHMLVADAAYTPNKKRGLRRVFYEAILFLASDNFRIGLPRLLAQVFIKHHAYVADQQPSDRANRDTIRSDFQ